MAVKSFIKLAPSAGVFNIRWAQPSGTYCVVGYQDALKLQLSSSYELGTYT
jgi:hypothetical protein